MIFETVYLVLLFISAFFMLIHLNLWFENKKNIFSNKKHKFLPSVSLIIPAYNEEDVIGETMRKMKNVNYPRNKLEIIVVDDGSTDRTYEIAKKTAKKLGPKLKQIRIFTKKNGGKASALNFGIKKAKNEFIAVVDADSFLDKNALRECVSYFNSDEVAAVTSHILCSKKRNFWERMQNIELMIISVTRKLQEFLNIIWVTPGPLSVYRGSVLKKLGGFDEKNLVEDVEIAWRILKNGYKIRMAFDAFAYSLYPKSFKKWWKQRVRWSIGGLQTLTKYKSSIGAKHHTVGSFLVPTSFLGYSSTIIGLGIFLYLLSLRSFNFLVYVFRAYSLGLNPFLRQEFSYYMDLKIILGLIVFAISLPLLKATFSLHEWKVKWIKWYDIPLFLFIYTILYSFVNLHGIYKYFRGERGWLTK